MNNCNLIYLITLFWLLVADPAVGQVNEFMVGLTGDWNVDSNWTLGIPVPGQTNHR